MFKASTSNLAEDFIHAGVVHGTRDLGEVTPEQLMEILNKFAKVDPVENFEAEPAVVVTGKGGKFSIRTGEGNLFAYNARDASQPCFELTDLGVLDDVAVAATVPDTSMLPQQPIVSPERKMLAFAIFFAAVLINAYTIYSSFGNTGKHVDDLIDITFVTDPAAVSSQESAVAGTYETGSTPGNRLMVLKKDGSAAFSVIQQPEILRSTFQPALQEGRPCLITAEKGVIHLIDPDTVEFYRDIYHRIK